jgi:hypothetical protein
MTATATGRHHLDYYRDGVYLTSARMQIVAKMTTRRELNGGGWALVGLHRADDRPEWIAVTG